MFALVKRVGEKDENLASFFYPILLSTNTLLFTFPIKFVRPDGFFDPPVLDYALKFLLIIF